VEGHFLDNARSHLWGLVHLRQKFARWSHRRSVRRPGCCLPRRLNVHV